MAHGTYRWGDISRYYPVLEQDMPMYLSDLNPDLGILDIGSRLVVLSEEADRGVSVTRLRSGVCR